MERIKKERGYTYEDVIEISPEKLPNYEEKVEKVINHFVFSSLIIRND